MKNKTIRTPSAKYLQAVRARATVTFTMLEVPAEWQAYQAKIVFKATASKRRCNLQAFGLSTLDTMDCYLGIQPSGSFSMI